MIADFLLKKRSRASFWESLRFFCAYSGTFDGLLPLYRGLERRLLQAGRQSGRAL